LIVAILPKISVPIGNRDDLPRVAFVSLARRFAGLFNE
jgi:hypothetical protein